MLRSRVLDGIDDVIIIKPCEFEKTLEAPFNKKC